MASHRSCALVALIAVSLATPGCDDSKKRMAEKLKKREAEKKAVEDAKAAKLKAETPKNERAKLDPPWAGEGIVDVANGAPCPEGLWALFPDTPGEGADKEANEKKRPAYVEKLKGVTLSALLPLGGVVAFGAYDRKRKALPVQIDGVFGCYDKGGTLAFALTSPAKPFRPKPSEDGDLSPQAVWRAPPLIVRVPFPSAAEAKEFTNGKGTGLEARIAFTVAKVEVDKKFIKPPKPPEGAPPVSDAAVDWGAGRLVHAEIVGVRLGVDHEKSEVAVDLRKHAER